MEYDTFSYINLDIIITISVNLYSPVEHQININQDITLHLSATIYDCTNKIIA